MSLPKVVRGSPSPQLRQYTKVRRRRSAASEAMPTKPHPGHSPHSDLKGRVLVLLGKPRMRQNRLGLPPRRYICVQACRKPFFQFVRVWIHIFIRRFTRCCKLVYIFQHILVPCGCLGGNVFRTKEKSGTPVVVVICESCRVYGSYV